MKGKPWRQTWLQILVGGVLLFALTERALAITGNTNFVPSVILLGSSVMPVTMVAYFYQHVRDRDISMPLLTTCFVVGGTLGLVAAGFLEYQTMRGVSIFGIFTIGIIEEAVKLIFPIGMYIAWKYPHEADGLLFGVAAGMGFASLETMGYAMTSFVQSNSDIITLQQVLIIRGLLAPAGHAAWTGFVCAVLWRQREQTGRVLSGAAIWGYVVAVTLHVLWNLVLTLPTDTSASLTIFVIGSTTIFFISLTLIIRRYQEAKRFASGSEGTSS